MFKLKGICRPERKAPSESSERLRLIYRAAQDYPGYKTALLDSRFDPAFLYYVADADLEVARAVYCRDLASDILASEVAGLSIENAEEELYLLISTFPEGQVPLTD